MKLKYSDLLNGAEDSSKLLEMKPAPIARVAAQLARNIRKANDALDDFKRARKVLLDGVLDDNHASYESLPQQVKDRVDAEFNDLLNSDVEVDIHPVSMEDLAHIEELKPGFEVPVGVFVNAWFLFE